MRQILALGLTAMALCAIPASAENAAPTAAVAADPAKGQAIVAQVCSACHAGDGNSIIPQNPSLAGQHAEYISKQLANFKSGERKNAIMMGMSAGLSPADMQNLGAYFSAQTPRLSGATDKALAELGQKIYRAGDPATGVPACAGCHSPTGAGIPSQFPRLAGQHPEYVVAQLKAFRSWERGNDNGKQMRTIASRLSDHEMDAVAQYVAGLH